MQAFPERAFNYAIGALWITLYGAISSSVILGAWPIPPAIACWILITAALFLAGVVQALRIRRLAARPVKRHFDRTLARKIGSVLFTYAAAAGLVANALHALRHDPLIFPVLVGVVGIHFWAFARVLGYWQYYVTGVVDLVTVAITLATTGSQSQVGSLSAWVFYPLLGNGAALFVTAAMMLAESVMIVAHQKRSRPEAGRTADPTM